MADYAGVSIDTASKYKKIMNEAPEEIKKEVEAGQKSINKAYQEIRNPVRIPESEADKVKKYLNDKFFLFNLTGNSDDLIDTVKEWLEEKQAPRETKLINGFIIPVNSSHTE